MSAPTEIDVVGGRGGIERGWKEGVANGSELTRNKAVEDDAVGWVIRLERDAKRDAVDACGTAMSRTHQAPRPAVVRAAYLLGASAKRWKHDREQK